MAQPVIYAIPSFDADLGTNVAFAYEGDQVFGNELVITDNETAAQVYDIKMEDWMRLYHTIGVDSGLVNGKYYACKLRVFNKENQPSDWSTWRSFYCFKTPILRFANISNGDVIQSSEFTFNLEYEQEQNEPLNMYNVMLYNANRVLLSKSGNLYGSETLQYTIRQFEDGTQYYIRATGSTLNGMTVDTGYISFSVKYVVPSYWTYVDLSNNADDGSIRISCNIRSVTGVFEGDGSPTYIENKMVDLRNGDKVVFNDGFVQSGNFCVKILGSGFKDNEIFYEMLDDSNTRITLKYREGWFSTNTTIASGEEQDDEMQGCWIKYVIVTAEPKGGVITYTINSDAMQDLQDGQEYLIILKRSYDVYGISVENVNKTEDINE